MSIYCPYTNRVLSLDEVNNEHIVPLSLGGANAFVIPVCRRFNSEVGSSIDGAMTKDFLVAIERTRYDARGHSGRKPTLHVKRAKLGVSGRPAQVHMSVRDGLRIWDAVEGRDLSPAETAGATIAFQTIIDLDLRLKFTAKVALGAGYAVYGDVFKDHVQHHDLRGVMNQKKDESVDQYRDFMIRADDPLLTPEPKPGSQLEIVRGVCNSIKGSIVMLIPSAEALMVAVGILGKYVGMLNVAAETTRFPNSGPYAWGHVVVLMQGRAQRCSLTDLLKKVESLGQAGASAKTAATSPDEGEKR